MKNFAFVIVSIIMYLITIGAPLSIALLKEPGFIMISLPIMVISSTITVISYYNMCHAVDKKDQEDVKSKNP